MKKKISMLAAVLCLGMLFLFSACGKDTDTNTIRVNEVTHSVFYAPFYVAMEEGYFAEEGLEIELINGGGSDNSMTALLTGAADVALLGPETAVYVKNEGREDHAVIIAQLTQADGSFLLGKEPEDDFQWENLAGKSIIGGRTGGMPEMMLEYVLKQHGLTPNVDLTVRTDVDFDLMGGAFLAGEDDYVTLFEPSASMMEKENQGYIVASLGEAAGKVPYTCFMMLKSELQANPELAEAFVRAVYRGQQYVNTHSAEEIANAIAGCFPDNDVELLTAVAENYLEIGVWKDNPILEEEDYAHLLDIIMEAGVIDHAPELEEITNRRIAEQAME